MSKTRKVPSYRTHKQSGQAIVTLTDGFGSRRDILLGKYGTAASWTEYARVLAEWEAAGKTLANPVAVSNLVINELISVFWKHAEQHYRRPDGTSTQEFADFKLSIRPLKHLYGETTAKDFGPLALKTVRQLMVDGYEHPRFGPQRPLARGVINQRVGRIRRIFRWAVENELVPASVLHGLQSVRGLMKGRSQARETAPVRPVPVAVVDATIPHLRPQLGAMVQLQLHTGMRPGEVVVMRALDIQMTGPVWLYRPGSDQGLQGAHKTSYRGHQRIVPIGPRGQEIIRKYLKTDLQAYLFSPKEVIAELLAEQRQNRKSKVPPSQMNRRRRKPRKSPGDRYTVCSYGRAIASACIKAGIPHWHPHQLRHTKATEIRREAGLDAARAVLGHRTPAITEVYAELDLTKAAEVMERLG
jgi:integrase